MIEVRRLGPQIGAEINGVDVKTMDDATFGVIYRAWLDYNVVAVRGQESPDRRFPRPTAGASGSSNRTRPRARAIPTVPKSRCSVRTKFGPDGKLDMAIYKRGAEGWHTDGSYERGAVQGDAALRARDSEPRRRHAVREHVRRVRRAARAAQTAPAEFAWRLRLRRPRQKDVTAQRGRPQPEAGLPSADTHASRDRTQGALLRSQARSCASKVWKKPRATR